MDEPCYHMQSVRLNAFTPEQLLEVVRGARLEHYLLSNSQCDARLDRWSSGDFSVDRGWYSFPVRAVGSFSSERHCIGYMRQSNGGTWINGLKAGENSMEFYPAGCEMNYCAAAGGEWVAIEFTEEALQAAARQRLGCEMKLPWKHVASFRLSPARRAALDHMVSMLWYHPVSGSLMVQPILETIAETLHSFASKSFGGHIHKSEHRQFILKRCDDFLSHHLYGTFDLLEMAAAAGTTARTLQRTFVDAYGVTPGEWARCVALHRVRERLRSSESRLFTVQGIAEECGFKHVGRFSSYYRELFGEAPSLTRQGGMRREERPAARALPSRPTARKQH